MLNGMCALKSSTDVVGNELEAILSILALYSVIRGTSRHPGHFSGKAAVYSSFTGKYSLELPNFDLSETSYRPLKVAAQDRHTLLPLHPSPYLVQPSWWAH